MARWRDSKIAVLLLLLLPALAAAHSFPSDLLQLESHPQRLDGSVILHGGALPRGTTEAQALLDRGLVLGADGSTLTIHVVSAASYDAETTRVAFSAPWSAPPRDLTVRCRLYPDHKDENTLVYLHAPGRTEAAPYFLDAKGPAHTFPLAMASAGEAFAIYVREGVRHIFTGPDHIAFILGLILLGGTLWRLAGIVTAFTLAHSVTLALAVLGLVVPPARVIEPLIALSIVWIGIENLKAESGKLKDRRAVIAFGFGLVHGFGFAEVLRDAGLPRAVLGSALFSFNLGVEAGQLAIVLAALPVLAFLRRRGFKVERLSWAIVAAGSWWFIMRLI